MTFFTVAIYSFVPWVAVLFVLSFVSLLPRGAFIAIHYVLTVCLFGLVFHFFYETHAKKSSFITTIFALISLFLFELIFWNFFSSDAKRYLNFVDWIFPLFLIATTVYALGKRSK